MKKCPYCKSEITYKKLLFAQNMYPLKCNTCGSEIIKDVLKMLPIGIVAIILAMLFTLTYASTGYSEKWLKILIGYFILLFFIEPFFIKLRKDKGKN